MMFVIFLSLLLLIILITGLIAVFLPRLFGSGILFSAFSFFVVLAYLLLSAPDVAFTVSGDQRDFHRILCDCDP